MPLHYDFDAPTGSDVFADDPQRGATSSRTRANRSSRLRQTTSPAPMITMRAVADFAAGLFRRVRQDRPSALSFPCSACTAERDDRKRERNDTEPDRQRKMISYQPDSRGTQQEAAIS